MRSDALHALNSNHEILNFSGVRRKLRMDYKVSAIIIVNFIGNMELLRMMVNPSAKTILL